MKKILSLIFVLSLVFSLISCNPTEKYVDRVFVDGESLSSKYSCYTIYLYAFKDAEIGTNYESTSSQETPSSTGYIYSTEKLEVGDTITVWNEFDFGEVTTSWLTYRQTGTEAIVDKIVDIYKVKVASTEDTYIITYYSVSGVISYTSVCNKEDLKEIEQHTIEVSKERVTIEHDT